MLKRSYYSNSIKGFLREDPARVFNELCAENTHRVLEDQQKNAWKSQIDILRNSLKDFDEGRIYFEFSIPRMGKRVDNVVIINDFIFVLEFKVGENQFPKYAIEQVVDYCLDLQNFHEGSHFAKLVPILISTKGPAIANQFSCLERLFNPILSNKDTLTSSIREILTFSDSKSIDSVNWENSVYKPTPTIIEAAQALYKKHDVKEISRHDAGAINLSKTTDCINRIIEKSKANGSKSICFLTGVPGAGKTLAGLNIANERMKADEDEHAVFLSGNGPLVDVLREALTRDSVLFAKENGETSTKKKEKERAVKFIQNIHHFRDDNLRSDKAPIEKVVVFDEAQRAWTKDQASAFMQRKKGIDDFDMSEPQFLIDVMNRHQGWCTIICLIGGGQEINTGEAGLAEWISALREHFGNWDIHFSNLISTEQEYLSDGLQRNWLCAKGTGEDSLHLAVSVRSFRSEKVSELVHAILELEIEKAIRLIPEISNDFPIKITRDLEKAKTWLKSMARGTERYGLVASSGGRRLRPVGIDVKNEISAENWFLNSSDDIRSSFFLEEVATEFDIQGLEIDWVCLAWDINLTLDGDKWQFQNFSGTKWSQIHSETDRKYLINAYRVLLTRARQGIIIFVPTGNSDDMTRPSEKYDSVYEYLISLGIEIL